MTREEAQMQVDAAHVTTTTADTMDAKDAEIARLRAQKDGAYSERDQCVALIARMAVALGYRAGLGRHVGGEWDDDWRNIVFIDLPAGQVSWHIHDSELPLFDFLGQYEAPWDGHSTAEKYERCRGALRPPPPSLRRAADDLL